MSDEFRAYQVTECEWMAARSAQEAIAEYLKIVGDDSSSREMLEEFGPPQEMSSEDARRLMVTDVDEIGQPKHSFAELLKMCTEPTILASTEY